MSELGDIQKQLAELHADFRAFAAGQEEAGKAAAKEREEHRAALFGVPGVPGLVRKVQDLQSQAAVGVFLVGTLLTGVLGAGAYEIVARILRS